MAGWRNSSLLTNITSACNNYYIGDTALPGIALCILCFILCQQNVRKCINIRYYLALEGPSASHLSHTTQHKQTHHWTT